MTDNEIIKALECCADYDAHWIHKRCGECPIKGTLGCIPLLVKNAYDLVSRQNKSLADKGGKRDG